MGGMGLSGVGRPARTRRPAEVHRGADDRHRRVLNLDPPFGVSPTLWQKSLLPMVQAVMKLPGRN